MYGWFSGSNRLAGIIFYFKDRPCIHRISYLIINTSCYHPAGGIVFKRAHRVNRMARYRHCCSGDIALIVYSQGQFYNVWLFMDTAYHYTTRGLGRTRFCYAVC